MLLVLLLVACTGKVSGSDTADTDPCTGAVEREAFIAMEVSRRLDTRGCVGHPCRTRRTADETHRPYRCFDLWGGETALAATWNVTVPTDTYDKVYDSDCSLRDAIWEANQNAGDDEVILPTGRNRTYQPSGSSGEHGGAVFCDGCTLSVTGSDLWSNLAEGNGGAVAVDNGTLDITGTLLWVNEAQGTAHDGGAIRAFNSTTAIQTSDLWSNAAGHDGGAIAALQGSITLDEVESFYNVAGNAGGALRASYADAEVSDASFFENQAVNGGGIAVLNGTVHIQDTEFEGNQAVGTHTKGGALHVVGLVNTDAFVRRSSFIRNASAGTGSKEGGAIWISHSIVSGATHLVVNPTLSENTAAFGGAIAYMSGSTGSPADLELLYLTFYENDGYSSGSDIYATAAATITQTATVLEGATSDPCGRISTATTFTTGGGNVSDFTASSVCMLGSSDYLGASGLNPLGYAGGATRLHTTPSSHLSRGWFSGCSTTYTEDQHQTPRPLSFCDAGAWQSP